jgi:hypothetical protein
VRGEGEGREINYEITLSCTMWELGFSDRMNSINFFAVTWGVILAAVKRIFM